MKKKETIYMGGERDEQKAIMPKYFENFFNVNVNLLFFILVLLIILLIFMKLQF